MRELSGTVRDAAADYASDPGLRVLLFDAKFLEHETTTELLRDAFHRRCTVESACLSGPALELIRKGVHDLYVIALGRRAGNVLSLIRAGADRAPVIALAESADGEAQLRALAAGASECVAKPKLSRQALAAAFRQAAHRHQGASRDKRLRLRFSREADRLNSLQQASHSLSERACHDIRSPLTVIKTFSSILLSELAPTLDAEQARFLRTIMRRTDDLGRVIDSILDASLLASDLVGSHREAFAADDLVDDLRPELEQMAAAAEVQLRIRSQSSLPDVFCDRANIGRVVQSLVETACKAAGQGGSVELWLREEPGEKSVSIGVTDNRFHVPSKELYEEAGEGLRRRATDSGSVDLSLHLANELVRINLGVLSVTKPSGGGSVSAFTLPVVDLDRILSSHLKVLESGRQTVSALSVAIATVSDPEQHPNNIVRFLWSKLRPCDLVIPLRQGGWALCISCNADDMRTIIRRVSRSFEELNRSGPAGLLPVLRLRTLGAWPLSASSNQIAAAIRRAEPAGPDLSSMCMGRFDPSLAATAAGTLSTAANTYS